MNESGLTLDPPDALHRETDNFVLKLKCSPPLRESIEQLRRGPEAWLAGVALNPQCFPGELQDFLGKLLDSAPYIKDPNPKPEPAQGGLCDNCGSWQVNRRQDHLWECASCGTLTRFRSSKTDQDRNLATRANFGDKCKLPTPGNTEQIQEPSHSPTPGNEASRLPPFVAPVTCINAIPAVLLVGIYQGVAQIFRERFEKKGFAVRSACDPDNALRLCESSGPFAVVMIDLGLPEDGCLALARMIRENDPSQKMVIVALDYLPGEVERRPGLADIPVLNEVRQLADLVDSIRPWANRDEVFRAIQELSRADLRKIRKVAELKGWGSADCNWEDLLQEALLRTLAGADDTHHRKAKGHLRWDPRTDFVTFLTGAIRSMSYHRKRKSGRLDADELMDNRSSKQISADESLIGQEERARKENHILGIFTCDPEAGMVLGDLLGDLNYDEIRQKRSFSGPQLKAILKRIRTRIAGTHNGGGEKHDG